MTDIDHFKEVNDVHGHLAEKLRLAVEQLVTRYKSTELNVTISLGFTLFSPEIKDYLQMLHDADIALYHSKKNGRNQTSQFKNNECVSVLTD